MNTKDRRDKRKGRRMVSPELSPIVITALLRLFSLLFFTFFRSTLIFSFIHSTRNHSLSLHSSHLALSLINLTLSLGTPTFITTSNTPSLPLSRYRQFLSPSSSPTTHNDQQTTNNNNQHNRSGMHTHGSTMEHSGHSTIKNRVGTLCV